MPSQGVVAAVHRDENFPANSRQPLRNATRYSTQMPPKLSGIQP